MIRIDFDRYAAAAARKRAAMAEIQRLANEAAPHKEAAQDADWVLNDRMKLRDKLGKAVTSAKSGKVIAVSAVDKVVNGDGLSLYAIGGGCAETIGESWKTRSRVKVTETGWVLVSSGGKLRPVTLEELEAALVKLGSPHAP